MTLIEVSIVVLLIGILVAASLPTFVGGRNRAQDVEAQARLDTAIKAADVYYSTDQTFSGLTDASGSGVIRSWGVTALQGLEPSVTFTAGTLDTSGSTAVDGEVHGTSTAKADNGQLLALWTPSRTGTWYCAVVAKQYSTRWRTYPDSPFRGQPGVFKGRAGQRTDVDSAAECFERATGW